VRYATFLISPIDFNLHESVASRPGNRSNVTTVVFALHRPRWELTLVSVEDIKGEAPACSRHKSQVFPGNESCWHPFTANEANGVGCPVRGGHNM
jgi:hypothetical protein